MSGDTIQILIAMIAYMLVVVGIGLFFAKRAQANSENYFLGGRSLGPWVAAMSAEASDMSGWLLMGLPGLAYWSGIADSLWTAIGLGVGTYINWLLVAKRLRQYSTVAGNSITHSGLLKQPLPREQKGDPWHRGCFHPDLLHRLRGKLLRHLRKAVLDPV